MDLSACIFQLPELRSHSYTHRVEDPARFKLDPDPAGFDPDPARFDLDPDLAGFDPDPTLEKKPSSTFEKNRIRPSRKQTRSDPDPRNDE